MITNLNQYYNNSHFTQNAYQMLVDSTLDYAIFMLDKEGIIKSWNKGAKHIKGYDASEVIGKHVSIFYTPDAVANNLPQQELQITCTAGRYQDESWRVRKDGRHFWASVMISPIYDANNNLIGYGKITRDLTEQRKIQVMKNEFISVISHELRTPLTSIQGALSLVLTQALGELPEKITTILNIANQNCERLTRLINDILDIEKIEAGKMQFSFKPLNLAKVVTDAVIANKMYANKYNVTIFTDTLDEDLIISADADRLMQALTNLISNAVKFSPINDNIIIGTQQVGLNARIFVKDNGPGIPKEFHHLIFEKFSQAHTLNVRQKGGTGLGLAISKAIIDNHGGTLNFESNMNHGTLFYIDLPILKDNL